MFPISLPTDQNSADCNFFAHDRKKKKKNLQLTLDNPVFYILSIHIWPYRLLDIFIGFIVRLQISSMAAPLQARPSISVQFISKRAATSRPSYMYLTQHPFIVEIQKQSNVW